MDKKLLLGLGLGATVLTLGNIDKVDAASLTTTANLNMRSGPSTSNPKIGYIKAGTAIQYISASNGWYKVKYNGMIGWVSGQYVKWGGTTNNNNNIGSIKNTTTVTIRENLNMRSGPSTSYRRVSLIKKGSVVTSTEKSNGWYKVKYNGMTGWVLGQYVSVGGSTSTGGNYNSTTTTKYTTANLNIRSNASTSSSKIGSIPQGKQVICLGSSNGWYKIKYNGITGWVSGQYLSSNKVSTNKSIATKILISRTQRTLKAYDKNGVLLFSSRCAVGKPSTPTPRGTFKIVNKMVNRPYYKDNIPGGDPRNPLGCLWMGLSINGGQTYGIHGNNNAASIGLAVSGGCIRVDNTLLKQLYNMCIIGTTVVIYD